MRKVGRQEWTAASTSPDRLGELRIEDPNWLAPKLARQLDLPAEDGMTLHRAACAHLVRKGRRKDIYEELRELVEEHAQLPIPSGLADLAAIRDFDVSATRILPGRC